MVPSKPGVDVLDVESSMHNLGRVVARLRERSHAPILIYNVSAVVPGDSVHCYEGWDETFANQITSIQSRVGRGHGEPGFQSSMSIPFCARTGADRLKVGYRPPLTPKAVAWLRRRSCGPVDQHRAVFR